MMKHIKLAMLLLVFLLIISLLRFEGVGKTAYFVFPINVTFAFLALGMFTFLLAHKLASPTKEPTYKENPSLICSRILEMLEKENIYNYKESWEIARKIIPELERLKSYGDFMAKNPEIAKSIRLIYNLYNHYHGGKRVKKGGGAYLYMAQDLKQLKENLEELVKKYKL